MGGCRSFDDRKKIFLAFDDRWSQHRPNFGQYEFWIMFEPVNVDSQIHQSFHAGDTAWNG